MKVSPMLETYVQQAEAHKVSGQWEEALYCYQQALELEPENWQSLSGLGDSLLNLERTEEAVVAYRRSLELNPEFDWVHHNLAVALNKLGKFEKADFHYEKLADLNPAFWEVNQQNFLVQQQLGEFCFRREDWVAAAAAYRLALTVNSGVVWNYINLGRALKYLGQWDEAIVCFREAIRLNPDWIEVRYSLCQTLIEQKRLDEALEVYQETLAAGLISPEIVQLVEFAQIEPEVRTKIVVQQSCSDKAIKEELDDLVKGVDEQASSLPKYDDPVLDVISKEFDVEFYLSTHPDVRDAGVDPIMHYYTVCRQEVDKNPNRWFSTKYYLESNEDLKDVDINPFWHYLIAGRAEGRCPQRPGGYRRQILEALELPSEKAKHYSYPEAISQIKSSHLMSILGKSLRHSDGIVVSISHDCYIKSIGGTQIFISDEQKKFNSNKYNYLHISPLMVKLHLAEEDLHSCWIQVALDGEYIGITTYEDLSGILRQLNSTFSKESLLVVHCVLGHQISGIISLQNAAATGSNYFWLHDYSSLCVGFNLLRNDIDYCGAPNESSIACRICIYGQDRSRHLESIQRLFTSVSFHVVAPSAFTLNLWFDSSNVPHLSASVHEHCEVEMTAYRITKKSTIPKGRPDNPVRVAYIGYPSFHKGWPVFLNLLTEVSNLPIYKFYHFASKSALSPVKFLEGVEVNVTPQSRNSMVEALASKDIDIVLMPAPWPETFSYVTYEAFASGAFVVTLPNSGNVAAVVQNTGRGIVVEDEAALIEYFSSYRVVELVRQKCLNGVETGSLVHRGTTASLVFSESEKNVVEVI